MKGEQAQLILLLQQLSESVDKSVFYQFSAVKGITDKDYARYREVYLSDAQQEERNAEHTEDELGACWQKLFESIAIVQVSFPRDSKLDEKIGRVEGFLTRSRHIFRQETIQEGADWAAKPDGAQQLQARFATKIPLINKAIQPVTDLLDYLSTEIQ